MGVSWILFGTFLGIVLLVARVSYKRLPPDIADKKQLRILFAFLPWLNFTGIIREYLGFGPRQLGLRALDRPEYITTPRSDRGVKYYDATFDGVRVRIYEPEVSSFETGSQPAIVFFHGGGWAIASVDSYHPTTCSISRRTGFLVISVDYRRAPEHPYPEPLEDCLKATLHFVNNAPTYNVDTTRVAVMGDSAGGNLAAALCLLLRDMKSDFKPHLQVLIYPVTQIIDLQLPSFRDPYQLLFSSKIMSDYITMHTGLKNINTVQLTHNEHVSRKLKEKYRSHLAQYLPEDFRKGYSMYVTKEDPILAQKFETFITDPYLAPLMAESLEDLPEAYVWTAQYDLLRDEGIMYANKLKNHGVEVTWVNKHDAMHGSWSFGFPSGAKYRKETCEFVKEKLKA